MSIIIILIMISIVNQPKMNPISKIKTKIK